MLEYKVMKAKNADEAQEIMNILAKSGWRVISTAYWTNFTVSLIITFEREKIE